MWSEKKQQLLDFPDGIGGCKLATRLAICFSRTGKHMMNGTHVEIPVVKRERVSIIVEYDENELVEPVEKHRCLIIKAKFAGAGKSAAEHMN